MDRLLHVVHVHPLGNYGFGQKPEHECKSSTERLVRMEARYAAEGARRSVEAVLLVNEHNHPHVLLLQARAPGRQRCLCAWRLTASVAGRQQHLPAARRQVAAGRGGGGGPEAQAAQQACARRRWRGRRRCAARLGGGRAAGQLDSPALRAAPLPVLPAARDASRGDEPRVRGAPA